MIAPEQYLRGIAEVVNIGRGRTNPLTCGICKLLEKNDMSLFGGGGVS